MLDHAPLSSCFGSPPPASRPLLPCCFPWPVPSLAGTAYNEEDDVVMQAKARRLAREKRLERTAAIAQQQQQQAAAEAR